MTRSGRDTARRVLEELSERGLLLMQDRALPNVVSLVTGETLRGSWWSHAQSHEIWRALVAVGESPDAVATKLVAGKVTFVHRKLWPSLIAVAMSGATWQTEGLSADARRLLARVRRNELVEGSGRAVGELEARLLARADEVHTESGAHRMILESWDAWAKRVGCRPMESPEAARREIEAAVRAVGGDASLLPWARRLAAGASRASLPRPRRPG